MQQFFIRFKIAIIWGIVIAFIVSSIGLYAFMRRPGAAQAEMGIGRIAVVVNGEKIEIAHFEADHAHFIRQHEQFHARMGREFTPLLRGVTGALLQLQLRAQTMERVIRHTLLGQEITRQRIRPDSRRIEAEFQREYDELLRVHRLTEERLRELLAAHRRTLHEFKDNMRNHIQRRLQEEELRRRVVGTIIPTEAELEAFFAENIARYEQPEEVRASHILVADEALAKEISTKLAAGAPFAELAREYSTCPSAAQGGDLGRFGRGRMDREFEVAAFGLEVGGISEITRTRFGYHIIKLTGRWPAHRPALDEIRTRVTADFITAEEQRRFEDWYEEELRKAATVEIKLPLVAAQLLYQQDPLLGLAEFKRIRDQRIVDDPHLGFFIGQIYEAKWREMLTERGALEAKEERTPAEQRRLAELIEQSAHYRTTAVANYELVLQQGRAELDERFLQRILSLDPKSVIAIYHLGRFHQERGDRFGADSRFREAISIDPAFLPAVIAVGEIAFAQGFYRVAVEHFQRALELQPGAIQILVNLSQAYIRVGELDQAAATLTAVLQKDPRNPHALTGMGDLSYERLRIAASEAETLQARDDLTAEEERRLSKLQAEIEYHGSKTINYYQQVMQITPSLDLQLRLGRAHLAAGSIERAKSIFEEIIRRAPFTGEAFYYLGNIHLQQGNEEAALVNFRLGFDRTIYRSITLEPDKAALRLALGRQIIELAPDDVQMRFRVARVYEDHFMWSGAIRHYAAILELDPTSIAAWREIANAHLQRADHDIAQEYLWRAIPHTQDDDERLSIYQQIIDIERAKVGRDRPLGRSGLDARLEMAKIHIARENIDQARELLKKIQADDPTHRVEEVQGLLAQITPPVEESPPADGSQGQHGSGE
ncbi:tetratricopeptide repeat protein [Candidatus Acetothermia bacterium]|nr:tetratricopeptide repeat protein [Candidatus Acetothermia bacterium]